MALQPDARGGEDGPIPYLECPGCRLSLYSAATESWIDGACPVCGASLLGASKRFPSDDGVTVCHEFRSRAKPVASACRALEELRSEVGAAVQTRAASIVRELVAGCVKYTKARDGVIELLVRVTPTVVRVEISDDGEGFGAPAAADARADWDRAFE